MYVRTYVHIVPPQHSRTSTSVQGSQICITPYYGAPQHIHTTQHFGECNIRTVCTFNHSFSKVHNDRNVQEKAANLLMNLVQKASPNTYYLASGTWKIRTLPNLCIKNKMTRMK